MKSIPHVALLIETSREYARGLLRGVARYHQEHGPWSIFFEPHGLNNPPPRWLRNWRRDCEKALSLTIGDGQAMIEAVRKHERILQTGSHERSNPNVRRACELVQSGAIGKVKRVVAHVGRHNKIGPGPGWQPTPIPEGFDYDLWLGPAPEAPYHKDRCLYNFRFNYDYAGGQNTNFGAHSLDIAQWGLGMDNSGPVKIEHVFADYLPEGSLFNAATYSNFRCTYANGVSLDCVKSRNEPEAPVEVGHRSASLCHLGNIAIQLKSKLKWNPASEQFVGSDEANELIHRPVRGSWQI